MKYSVIIPAFLAATTMALPAVKYVTEVEVVHLTVTAGTPEASAVAAPKPAVYQPKPQAPKKQPAPAPAPAKAPAPAAAPSKPLAALPPVVTYTAAPAPAPEPTKAAPTPAPQPSQPAADESSNDGSPTSDGESILKIFNSYRSKYGLSSLKWSDKLAANAQKTGDDGHGRDQIHQLPELDGPGSCAQVITPGSDVKEDGYGSYTPFDVAMLSWLCEVVTPEISSECPSALSANRMDVSGTQAHHEAIVTPDFNQVGCAFAKNDQADSSSPWTGLWTCSLET